MAVNADQTFSGDSIFENIYVHGKLVAPEEAVSIFRQILVKEGIQITGDRGLPGKFGKVHCFPFRQCDGYYLRLGFQEEKAHVG